MDHLSKSVLVINKQYLRLQKRAYGCFSPGFISLKFIQMAESWNKREREKKKQQLKNAKADKKKEKKEKSGSSSMDDMIAYVDEDGNLSATPPDPSKKKVIDIEEIETGVPRQTEERKNSFTRTGVVTYFDAGKGYGFIKDDNSKESIFVHINALSTVIKENNKVSFETTRGPKGLNAINVSIIA